MSEQMKQWSVTLTIHSDSGDLTATEISKAITDAAFALSGVNIVTGVLVQPLHTGHGAKQT